MAAQKSSRTAIRKVKDKWKAKEWYRILAPDMFNHVQIAETLSSERSNVIGRTTEVTLQDLTSDFSKMHIKLQFQVYEVNGFDAHTRFMSHSLTSDYIRRLTRRKHSKTDGVIDVRTKDNALIRVKPMAVTEKRIQVAQQRAIRAVMNEVTLQTGRTKTSSEFIRDIISGNLSKNILKACKVIYPLKRVEIRRSEVLENPTIEIIPEKVEEEEKEEIIGEEVEGEGEKKDESAASPPKEPAPDIQEKEKKPSDSDDEPVDTPKE